MLREQAECPVFSRRRQVSRRRPISAGTTDAATLCAPGNLFAITDVLTAAGGLHSVKWRPCGHPLCARPLSRPQRAWPGASGMLGTRRHPHDAASAGSKSRRSPPPPLPTQPPALPAPHCTLRHPNHTPIEAGNSLACQAARSTRPDAAACWARPRHWWRARWVEWHSAWRPTSSSSTRSSTRSSSRGTSSRRRREHQRRQRRQQGRRRRCLQSQRRLTCGTAGRASSRFCGAGAGGPPQRCRCRWTSWRATCRPEVRVPPLGCCTLAALGPLGRAARQQRYLSATPGCSSGTQALVAAGPGPRCILMRLLRLPAPPRRAGYSAEQYRPVVLVSCGSFNPPTFMHLRMLELARQHLTQVSTRRWLEGLCGAGLEGCGVGPGCRSLGLWSSGGLGCRTALAQAPNTPPADPQWLQGGWDVLGCYMSPVNDAYWKQVGSSG